MRCLDGLEDEDYGDLLYQNLLGETKEFVASDIPQDYRTELEVRAYWDNVRALLKVEDDIDVAAWQDYEVAELSS